MIDWNDLSQLVPEWEQLFRLRYALLEEISGSPGIGRRQLAKRLEQTERRIRNEIEILSRLGLIDSGLNGLNMTQLGNQVMYRLDDIYARETNRRTLENELAKDLGIKRVRIAKDPDDVAAIALIQLSGLLEHITTLGITGGTSVKRLVDRVIPDARQDLTVVPARGSLGQETSVQANTLAEELARKLQARFYPLIAIDQLQHDTREQMLREPLIRRTLEQMEKIDGLIFGIGRADDMMIRRDLPPKLCDKLVEAGVVGEALGSFFNPEGKRIHELETFGIRIEHLQTLDFLMAIAYGKDKAQAVVSVSHINPNIILVTDRSCAEEMSTLLGGRNNGKSSN